MSRANWRKPKSKKSPKGLISHADASQARAEEVYQRVVGLRVRGEFRAAADLLRQCLDIRETGARWCEWALLQLAIENLEEAEKGFRSAHRLNPRDTLATANLSVVLEQLGQLSEANSWASSCPFEVLNQQRAAQNLLRLLGKGKPASEQFLEDIQTIPTEDPSLAPRVIVATRTTHMYSGYFVERCLERLASLPSEALPKVLEALEQKARADYRLFIVLALQSMQAEDYETALRHIRYACDGCPSDLYAENILIECSLRQAGKTGVRSEFEGLQAYLAGSFCETPWRHLEIAWDGHAFLCCPAWLPLRVGNARNQTLDEIWNSDFAIEIRKSILDKSFKFCSKVHCYRIAGRTLPHRADTDSPASRLTPRAGCERSVVLDPAEFPARVTYSPELLHLCYDRTCNMACPPCRKDFYLAKREERESMDRNFLPFVLRAAQDAKTVYLNGAGEVFASKHSRHLVTRLNREQFPHLKLWFISNGQLVNQRAFDDFDLWGRVRGLQISVDAARPETYRVVRRGGDFQRLLSNLGFLDHLRRERGESFRLELTFVVSGVNFREMPEFVELGKRFRVDSVVFTVLRNWGHLSWVEYEKLAVVRPSHPDHQEFLTVLRSLELSDPVVDLGSVAPYRLAQAQRND
jgi:MoaA/NifB/PqqE/SkfB family radical SAM enzyme